MKSEGGISHDISQDHQNKLGFPPERLLNKLRLFIKHNFYGQYIASLLKSIIAMYIIIAYAYH